jgi:hypothetical protein
MAQCHIQWLYLAVHGCKTYLNLNLNQRASQRGGPAPRCPHSWHYARPSGPGPELGLGAKASRVAEGNYPRMRLAASVTTARFATLQVALGSGLSDD